MWLDELNDLVEQLHERINKHRDILAKSESTTRYALIDPLLTKIGWDLSDPSKVRTEYVLPDNNRRLDYAMFNDGNLRLVLEAKKLGTPLDDAEANKALDQALQYTWRLGCRYLVVTNGNVWQGYDIKAEGKPDEQRRLNFCADGEPRGNDGPQRRIMDLLWLWPGNFKGDAARPNLHDLPVGQPASVGQPRKPARLPSRKATTPLSEVSYTKDMRHFPPKRLLFPDDTHKDVSNWASIQVAVVEWLIDNGRVKDLPVQNSLGTVLVHRTPTKADEKSKFRNPKEVRENHWIDMHYDAKSQLKRVAQILDACRVDPKTVRAEFN